MAPELADKDVARGVLSSHKDMAVRRAWSHAKLEELRKAFHADQRLQIPSITVFAAGSLGRLEAGRNSDLDLFVVKKSQALGKLTEARLLSRIADLNDELGFPPFADEMRYMKVYDGEMLVKDTGKPRDDSENFFTTRMLLLLESAPLINEELYWELMGDVCENYFRDNKGKKDFRPLFLLNDLLRYWRTLCLNYEECRADPEKPWRKKNVNLRFSRLTTVFSTIALLLVDKPSEAKEFISHTRLTPLERLAVAVDRLGDANSKNDFGKFIDHYSAFLRIKDSAKPEALLKKGNMKSNVSASAEFVALYFQNLFQHPALSSNSRYLML